VLDYNNIQLLDRKHGGGTAGPQQQRHSSVQQQCIAAAQQCAAAGHSSGTAAAHSSGTVAAASGTAGPRAAHSSRGATLLASGVRRESGAQQQPRRPSTGGRQAAVGTPPRSMRYISYPRLPSI